MQPTHVISGFSFDNFNVAKSLPPELIPYAEGQKWGGGPGTWSSDRLTQVAHFKRWNYIAIDTKAKAVVRHRARIGKLDEGGEIIPQSPHHPHQWLLDEPNAVDTHYLFMYMTVVYLETTGVAYWWQRKPNERWYLPSHWVWPYYSHGELKYYKVYPNFGRPLAIDPEEIIEFKYPNPLYPLDAMSPLWASDLWVDTSEQLDWSQYTYFMESLIPSIILEMTAGGPYGQKAMSDLEIERLKAKIRERFQGADKIGRPLILEPGITAKPMESVREMHYRESGDNIRDKIFATHRVPKTCAGIVDVVSRDNVYTSWLMFHHDAISPILQFFSETLTKDYRKRYNNDREVVYYPDNYPIDPEVKIKEWREHVKSGAVYANEYRHAFGLPPLADDFLLTPVKRTEEGPQPGEEGDEGKPEPKKDLTELIDAHTKNGRI